MLGTQSLFQMSFDIDGDQQFNWRLGVLASAVKDLRPVWDDIRDEFVKDERLQFHSEGSWMTEGWKPLSPKYAAWKSKHYPGRGIMVLTGALKASLTRPSDSQFLYRGRRLSLELGTKIPYAIYHQSHKPRKKLPRRVLIQLTDNIRKRWSKLIHEYIWKSGQGRRVILRRRPVGM